MNAVSQTTHVPLTGGIKRTSVRVEGDEWRLTGEPVSCTDTTVSPAYFDVLGLPIVKGRNFTDTEAAADLPVVMVGEALARRFWPNQDPLGRQIRTPAARTTLTVVGVVRNSSDAALWRENEMSIYFPMHPASNPLGAHLLLRASGDPRVVVAALGREAHTLEPNVKFDARPLDEVLQLWMLPSRVAAIGAAVLGAFALLMASVGIYGVVAYIVSQRTREIGVRVALGAGRHDVVRLVLAEGTRLIAIGISAGLAGSLATASALRGRLYDLSAHDPATFAGVPLLLAGVALAACYIPARRAARVDPMVALRFD